MTTSFAKTDGRVLIVEPIGSVRDAIRQALVAMGFTRIDAVNNMTQALRFLEVEAELPFWIVTTPMLAGAVNLLQLLMVLGAHDEFKHVRVSVFYRDADTSCLPKAFELGVLSTHRLEVMNPTVVADTLKALVMRMTANGDDSCIVAASYLREVLLATKHFDLLLPLETAMLRLYPRASERLLKMAEAYFHLGRNGEANAMLAQARYLSPTLAAEADALCRRFMGGEATVPNRIADVFRLKSCLIIDPDAAAHKTLEETFASVGVATVQSFTDPQDALAWIKKRGEPSVIVMEWKLSGMPGAAFLQRIRAYGHHNAMVIVTSSLVKALHKNLLTELGVACVIEKPVVRETLLKTLITTLRSGYLLNQYRVTVRKIEQLVTQGKLQPARHLLSQLSASKDEVPVEIMDLLEAKLAFAEEDFIRAREIIQRLLQDEPDSLAYLDLLGKILLRLGDNEAAVMCLQRANSLAPDNLERMCGLADAYTELGEFDVAQAQISTVRGMDAASPALLSSEVKHGFATGALDQAKTSLESMEMAQGVFGFMNNRAVAFARSGRFDRAVALYTDILTVLPEKHTEMLAAVRYNLGIVHIRRGDMETALTILGKADELPDARVGTKVASLLAKVKHAVELGVVLKFDEAAIREVRSGPTKLAKAAPARPGEFCCLGVFFAGPLSPDLTKLIATQPPFKKRDAISRGATTGRKASYS